MGNSIIEAQLTLQEEQDKEIERCWNSPYYYFTTYYTIDGKVAKTDMSENNFNMMFRAHRIIETQNSEYLGMSLQEIYYRNLKFKYK